MIYKHLFDNLRRKGSRALIPYFTALYPSQKNFEKSVIAAAEAGADIIEIGLPFSDPLADGLVIQHSSHYALTHGFTIERMFKSTRRLADKIQAPLVIMTYINPVLRYGVKRFIKECKNSGVSGLIIPDLIPEGGMLVEKEAARAGIAINYLIAPTTSSKRIRFIASRTTGFIYLVSVAGVTGERKSLPDYLPSVARRIRRITSKPLCIGFGISTPRQAKDVAALCDGVIIGSTLVKMKSSALVGRFLKQVKQKII
ncbi:MAG: tryptophan synthase subunit alpha [Planctomycetota bacterium]